MFLKGAVENKCLALMSWNCICERDRKGNYWLRNWKMVFKFSIFFPCKERKLGKCNCNPNPSCLAVPKSSSLLESLFILIQCAHTHTHSCIKLPSDFCGETSIPSPPIFSRILRTSAYSSSQLCIRLLTTFSSPTLAQVQTLSLLVPL